MNKNEVFEERKNKRTTNTQKQHSQGKLTAMERLNLLFDSHSFTEIGSMVTSRCTNFGMETKHIDGDGVITGFGRVNGRTVFAYAQDFTVLGGSLGEMQANKICKILDMAYETGCPVVGLNDSGGARIQEGIDSLAGYGRIFFRNTRASGRIPQITAIMGPSAGGAVYSPALTDFIFMTENAAKMFITGPSVIKAVTGEDVTADDLGGLRTHFTKSGVVHFEAPDDEECINRIKELLSYLPDNCMSKAETRPTDDFIFRKVPELNGILPENPNKPYDMREVISAIVDDGNFLEYQAGFACNIITCFAHIDGTSVGIIANQPKVMAASLDINASDKASRFVRTCDSFGIPLVTLVDVPGYLPGKVQEQGGIIRHGAKLIYAYCEATVPKVTVILRKAYGGAYLAMCSKELGADITLAWPTAEIAVMGADGAADIIFKNETAEGRQDRINEYKDEFMTPYKAAEHLLIDEVISPEDTRVNIAQSLKMLEGKTNCFERKRHGNIPL